MTARLLAPVGVEWRNYLHIHPKVDSFYYMKFWNDRKQKTELHTYQIFLQKQISVFIMTDNKGVIPDGMTLLLFYQVVCS